MFTTVVVVLYGYLAAASMPVLAVHLCPNDLLVINLKLTVICVTFITYKVKLYPVLGGKMILLPICTDAMTHLKLAQTFLNKLAPLLHSVFCIHSVFSPI
jgi:hypothetical protein